MDAQSYHKDKCSTMFTATLFVQSQVLITSPPLKDRQRNGGIFTQWSTTQWIKTITL